MSVLNRKTVGMRPLSVIRSCNGQYIYTHGKGPKIAPSSGTPCRADPGPGFLRTPAVARTPLAPINRHAVIILDGKQMREDGIYYDVRGKRISAGQKPYHGILLEKIGNP